MLVVVGAGAFVLGACSSGKAAYKPDWNGWARYEQVSLPSDHSVAAIIADGKQHHLERTCLKGQAAQLLLASQPTIPSTWFFLCGESYTRGVVNAAPDDSAKGNALATLDGLRTEYGKH
jgi:hypothetical protein